MEVLVEIFGNDWYENYWPYVRYLIDSTKRAWINQIKPWTLVFDVGNVHFGGGVMEFVDNWIVFAYIRDDDVIVLFDLMKDSCLVGRIGENDSVDWIKAYKDCGIRPIAFIM